jgi:hypothetical protein
VGEVLSMLLELVVDALSVYLELWWRMRGL